MSITFVPGGTADDTAAVQAALDTGMAMLQAGVIYSVTSLQFKLNKTRLIGNHATIKKIPGLDNTFVIGNPRFLTPASAIAVGSTYYSGPHECMISDVEINATGADYGIIFTGWNWAIENVKVYNAAKIGCMGTLFNYEFTIKNGYRRISAGDPGTWASVDNAPVCNRVHRCFLYACGDHALALVGTHQNNYIPTSWSNMTDGMITDCNIAGKPDDSSTGAALRMDNTNGWIIRGNHIYSPGLNGYISDIDLRNSTLFSGNSLERKSKFTVYGTFTTLSNNIFWNEGFDLEFIGTSQLTVRDTTMVKLSKIKILSGTSASKLNLKSVSFEMSAGYLENFGSTIVSFS